MVSDPAPFKKSSALNVKAVFMFFVEKMFCKTDEKKISVKKLFQFILVPNSMSKHLKNFNFHRNLVIKNADFLRTNFMIAIGFLSFILVVKLSIFIKLFNKFLKPMKYEA